MGELVRRLASALRAAGLEKGDRAAFTALNLNALGEVIETHLTHRRACI